MTACSFHRIARKMANFSMTLFCIELNKMKCGYEHKGNFMRALLFTRAFAYDVILTLVFSLNSARLFM